MILAIDPGPEKSAYVLWTGQKVKDHGILMNLGLRDCLYLWRRNGSVLVVEMIASYGMAVGAEVFETCVWTGRFVEAWSARQAFIYRREVKLALCGDSRAKDANIRQALIDRFGGKEKAIGKKANPGPLYGIKGDEWSALSVAITYEEKRKKPNADNPPF